MDSPEFRNWLRDTLEDMTDNDVVIFGSSSAQAQIVRGG